MTMISYAQNFEDVMLWRCFKNIGKGLYIDVGANDPVIDSVSLAFYNQGWRGINIEPSTQYYKKLLEARPDETIIQAALGPEAGEVTFYDIPSTGLSTTNLDIASQHEHQGLNFVETKIKQMTLDEIFAGIDTDVHWLKIDVEGAEKQVLEGWRNSAVKPWVLVIESTLPRTELENYDDWEKYVLDKGYEFVYFDGLNRFYLSNEHAELKKYFQSPPNVFDDFVLKKVLDLEKAVDYEKYIANDTNDQLLDAKQAFFNTQKKLKDVESERDGFHNKIKTTEEQLHNLQNEFEQLNEELNAQLKEIKACLNDKQNELNNKEQEVANKIQELNDTETVLEKTQAWGNSLHNKTCELEKEIETLKLHIVHLETQIDNMISSIYWRITLPARYTKSVYNALFKSDRTFKGNVKVVLNKSAEFISSHPNLHSVTVKGLKLTGLHKHAKQLRHRVADKRQESSVNTISSTHLGFIDITRNMTPHARHIFGMFEQERISSVNKGDM